MPLRIIISLRFVSANHDVSLYNSFDIQTKKLFKTSITLSLVKITQFPLVYYKPLVLKFTRSHTKKKNTNEKKKSKIIQRSRAERKTIEVNALKATARVVKLMVSNCCASEGSGAFEWCGWANRPCPCGRGLVLSLSTVRSLS